MNKLRLTLCSTLFAFLIPQVQAGSLNQAEKLDTIKSIKGLLAENYVFPDTATKMSEHLQTQVDQGLYSDVKEGKAFARQLTKDLQSISHDKHLRVMLDGEGRRSAKGGSKKSQEEFENRRERRAKAKNFGFEEVKILEGNIGYLKLTEFFDASVGGDTAVAAMNFFANAEALIIDLRKNGGGSAVMIQYISSHFFQNKTHLNSFYNRKTGELTDFWTFDDIEGKKRPNVPLYILTSDYTFSAAEEFAYNFQNLKRATVIGESTGGGANPIYLFDLGNGFRASIPISKAVNPISKTNWEGVGVQPDIVIDADKSFDLAYKMALETIKPNIENQYQLKDVNEQIKLFDEKDIHE